MEPLRHNASNPVTEGIWRIPWQQGTAIRKRIRGDRPSVHVDWRASRDPSSWLYWRREAEVYRSALPDVLDGTGLRLPRLLAAREVSEHAVELVLEDVPGRTGAMLSRADLVRAVRALGRAQARLHQLEPAWEWLSRGALRDHCASKHVEPALLDDDRAWEHPLVRDHWPPSLRTGLSRLHHRREELFAAMDAVPRTVGHLDFWSHNLIATPGDIVAIDWAFAGDAALGEDVANLLAEAALDELIPPQDLPGLEALLHRAYLDGLADEGLDIDPALVRLGQCAAAVKWHWLGPLHLERALTGGHHLYGGAEDPEPARQYEARGRTLAWLVARADEALALVDQGKGTSRRQ